MNKKAGLLVVFFAALQAFADSTAYEGLTNLSGTYNGTASDNSPCSISILKGSDSTSVTYNHAGKSQTIQYTENEATENANGIFLGDPSAVCNIVLISLMTKNSALEQFYYRSMGGECGGITYAWTCNHLIKSQ